MSDNSASTAASAPGKILRLRFHGKIIEHLGIQMYQSPVNAIAELIANSWDADAKRVDITLPDSVGDGAVFSIRDNGGGMTFEECEEYYLRVGRNRRGDDPDDKTAAGRPVLGRKGIGKFAGFGIARIVTLDTISGETGERTKFQLNLDEITGGEYVSTQGKEIEVLEYEGPDPSRKDRSGTTVELKELTIRRTPNPPRFSMSMARRFSLQKETAEFEIRVNGQTLPEAYDAAGFQYVFPRDLPDEMKDGKLITDEGWGVETIADSHEIKWRFLFHEDTIDEEELKGIAVFTKGKLAQRPFLFNIIGGLRGQHGVEYLAGQVIADYIDSLPEDLIATERQRINWEHDETRPLLDWGNEQLRECLKAWVDLRAMEKTRKLEEKVLGFAGRLNQLQKHERRTVKGALTSLAKVSTLSDAQFEELGDAVLTAWERGRLRDLVHEIAEAEGLTESQLLEILREAKVLTALQTLEVVATKVEAIQSLQARIQRQDLENEVRDFLAENPWLISPEWETFQRERGLRSLLGEAAEGAYEGKGIYAGRVDLALGSGSQLLVIELVRPGKKVDWDHLSRFERYVTTISERLKASTSGRFNRVTGYLISDSLENTPELLQKVRSMERDDMLASDWKALLDKAEAKWRDVLEILGDRGGEDARIREYLGRSVSAKTAVGEADTAGLPNERDT